MVRTRWKIFERVYSSAFPFSPANTISPSDSFANTRHMCVQLRSLFSCAAAEGLSSSSCRDRPFFSKKDPFITKHPTSAPGGVRVHGDWVISCRRYECTLSSSSMISKRKLFAIVSLSHRIDGRSSEIVRFLVRRSSVGISCSQRHRCVLNHEHSQRAQSIIKLKRHVVSRISTPPIFYRILHLPPTPLPPHLNRPFQPTRSVSYFLLRDHL